MTITADELRKLVVEELENLDFSFDEAGDLVLSSSNKDFARRLHVQSTQIELEKGQKWLNGKVPRYKHFFASGSDIVPAAIKPKLVYITERWQNDLWRIARYTWSLPYSKGYGRRLRYLVVDESNDKLIGVFALQSPPLSFPARDKLFNYPEGRKTELINQTMDIHTLGAVPPYARLLGGKLVALAAASNEVREDYNNKYAGRVTEMEGRQFPANLVALTTTSAFGRSSLYSRLKYKGEVIALSLGYTEGYGSFHLMKLYPLFREFLESQDISTRGGFGTGPRRKWQTMRRALDIIGLTGDLLKHGVKREAFLFPLAHNLDKYLEGRTDDPILRDLPFSELSKFWRQRWLIPRSDRVDGWHKWDSKEISKMLVVY